MKVSELWLRTFINPPAAIAELADQLTNAGIEVDNLEILPVEKTASSAMAQPNFKLENQGILTLKVPPNRGDCLSMEGVARELALLKNMPYSAIAPSKIAVSHTDQFPIQLDSPACPRYVGCIIKNIKANTETPAWIKARIELAGIRSVSVIVDILNYVMLELGQPMHAFDLNTLEKQIVVRNAKPDEKITLLNDQTITLTSNTMVIADAKAARAIAGIMGGKDSSVTDSTRNIFIESAYFDPISIRLSGKNTGIKTDSSHRFERGVDPNLQQRALERAVQLILESVGGEAGPISEQKNDSMLPKAPKIFLRKNRISRILGITLQEDQITEILKRAQTQFAKETQAIESNFTTKKVNEEGFSIKPPTYRQDLLGEIDIIEEIARVHGLQNISSEKLTGPLAYFPISEKVVTKTQFKNCLLERGYNEAITYSFIDPKLCADILPNVETFELANPIASDMATMRPSLWPGLLQAVQYNQRRQILRSRLFEMGVCFDYQSKKIHEKTLLSGVVCGMRFPEQWGESKALHDFFDIKKDVQALLSLTKDDTISFKKPDSGSEHPALHPGQSAEIMRNNKLIGTIGALHPRLLKNLELEGPVLLFELEVSALQEAKIPRFQALSKFPAIRRDIALLVDQAVQASDLKTEIEQTAGPTLQDICIFDVYQGKGIEPGKKSIAIGLILQHPSRTLVEGEGNDIIKDVILRLTAKFQAVLRE